MNKKNIGITIIIVFVSMCLGGCGNSTLNEKEIIGSLPEYVYELYEDYDLYTNLKFDELEITKRRTDEEYDEIYCTISMSCEDYLVTKDLYLAYMYFDEGGWILNSYSEEDVSIVPLTGVSETKTDAEMNKYYFDSYEFVEKTFDKDTYTTYTIYDVTYVCDNYSYDGQVTMISSFYEDDSYVSAVWDKELSYGENFDWNIMGSWAADDSDFSEGRSFRQTAFEIIVDAVDQSSGTIDFSARLYDCGLTDREVNLYKADDKSESIVVDYAGTEYLAHVKPVFDEAMTQEAKYKAPTLSFRTYVEDNEVIIKYEPYGATIHIGGYGGAYGNLQPGYGIRTWNNAEFGYIEMEKN